MRRFPKPWRVHEIPGGYRVDDAYGQPLAYVYGDPAANRPAKIDALTRDEARRIARAIARLPELLRPRA